MKTIPVLPEPTLPVGTTAGVTLVPNHAAICTDPAPPYTPVFHRGIDVGAILYRARQARLVPWTER